MTKPKRMYELMLDNAMKLTSQAQTQFLDSAQLSNVGPTAALVDDLHVVSVLTCCLPKADTTTSCLGESIQGHLDAPGYELVTPVSDLVGHNTVGPAPVLLDDVAEAVQHGNLVRRQLHVAFDYVILIGHWPHRKTLVIWTTAFSIESSN